MMAGVYPEVVEVDWSEGPRELILILPAWALAAAGMPLRTAKGRKRERPHFPTQPRELMNEGSTIGCPAAGIQARDHALIHTPRFGAQEFH